MGFFSSVTSGLLGGGDEGGGTAPTTSPFKVNLGRLGQAGFNASGALQSNLGGAFTPFLNQSVAQGVRGGVGVGAGPRSGINRLLQQGQSQFGLANALGREANQQTPGAEFDALTALLQPGEDQSRSALESRLFAQGRLGTTGGSQQQEAQETGFQKNRLAAAVQAITGSRQARADARGQASQALQNAMALTQGGIQGGFGLSDANLGIQQSSLQNLLGLQGAALSPLQTGGAVSGQTAAAGGGGGGGLGALLGGAAGSFLGPAGTAAGTQIGKNVFKK